MSQTLHMTVNNVRKILRNILQSYSYKITHVQELLPATKTINISLEFLVRMEVDHGWLCNILCSDDTNVYLTSHSQLQNMAKWWYVPNATIVRCVLGVWQHL